MDETSLFWEYLPRKVLTKKKSKTAAIFQRGHEKKKTTLCITVNAQGQLLPLV
jgi:hypothetical protein